MAASSLPLIPPSSDPRLRRPTRLPQPTTSAASPRHRDRSRLPFSASTISFSLPPIHCIPRQARNQPPMHHSPPSMPTGSVTTQHHRRQQQQQRQLLGHEGLLVENFHQNRKLGALLDKLTVTGCCPLQLLQDGVCWNNDEFWTVVRFLKESGRVSNARHLFDAWTKREPSRATDGNYLRIVRLLCEEGLVEDAASVLRQMVDRGVKPSITVFNSVVHGYAKEGDFNGARGAIRYMEELGFASVAETYHGLIQAYGKRRMYDEMSKCVRGMVSDGCSPNEVTYNMLIVEYARGGLLERMEGTYRTLQLKRMNLLASTLVVMLETYAELGVLEKMEKVYQKSLSSKAYLKDSLIRKLALVYIENYRFARLEEFGNEIASRTGRTPLVWCLLLLSSALLLSRNGMESIVREMKAAKICPRIMFTNILALAHMKLKDFRELDLLLSQIGTSGTSKPDLVTVGILFDACSSGFHGTRVLDVWRRNRFLERAVEMNTDPLVISAFGKGSFLQSCEEVFSVAGVGPKAREKKVWTYVDLIRCIFSSRKA